MPCAAREEMWRGWPFHMWQSGHWYLPLQPQLSSEVISHLIFVKLLMRCSAACSNSAGFLILCGTAWSRFNPKQG